MEELLAELQYDLENELASELKADSDKVLLSSKIKAAYLEARLQRNYQECHAEEFIDLDMEKLYPIIKNLVLYDFNHIGGEGELSHSENGISRSWHKRSDILEKITPFAAVF